MTSYEEY